MKQSILKKSLCKRAIEIKEITPSGYGCALAWPCPAIFSTDQDTFIIIGKTMSKQEAKKLIGDRVGDDETAVVVPKGMIKGVFEK